MTQPWAADATLAAALAALPLGVWVFGPGQRLAFANAAIARFIGLDPDLAGPEAISVGTPLAELVQVLAYRGVLGPGDPQAVAAQHLAVDRSRPFRRRIRRTDGACFEQLGLPLPAGGFVSVLSEITGHLAATEEAQAQARQLETLLARLHGGIAAYDDQRRVAFSNPAYEDLLGLPRGAGRHRRRCRHAAGRVGSPAGGPGPGPPRSRRGGR